MGKTETIKERTIYVYLPSIAMKEKWQKRSEELGISISKFVIKCVENSFTYNSRKDLIKENAELRQRIDELSRKCRFLEMTIDRLKEELGEYRAKRFIAEHDSIKTILELRMTWKVHVWKRKLGVKIQINLIPKRRLE